MMVAAGVIAVVLLIRSNRRFNKKKKEVPDETLFQTILSTDNPDEIWPLLKIYIHEKQRMFLRLISQCYSDTTTGFLYEKPKLLSRTEKVLMSEKGVLKGQRRKMTLCMRKVTPDIALEKSTWFHLSNNMAMSMTYNLRRVNEALKEHVDNNFRPLPPEYHETYKTLCGSIMDVLIESESVIGENSPEKIDYLRRRCNEIKDELSHKTGEIYDYLQKADAQNLTVVYVYLNVLQESQEFVTSLRKLLRAIGKLNLAHATYRSFSCDTVAIQETIFSRRPVITT